MTRLALICIILLMAATGAFAEPTTQPDADGLRHLRSQRGVFNREDIPRAMEFARDNMPALHAMIQQADEPMKRRRLIGVAMERYQRAQRVENDHPELYEAMLERFRSQDEVFGLLQQYQQAPHEEKEQAREQLRTRVRQMVNGWLDDRERRIANMKRMLEREARQLERDRAEVDRLTDEHIHKLMNLPDPTMAPGEMDPGPGRDRDRSPGGPPGDGRRGGPGGGSGGAERGGGPR